MKMQQILKLEKNPSAILKAKVCYSPRHPYSSWIHGARSPVRLRLCLTPVPIWESLACKAKVLTPSPPKTVLSLAGGASFISLLSLIFLFSSTHFLLPRHHAAKNVLITKLSHELVNKFNKQRGFIIYVVWQCDVCSVMRNVSAQDLCDGGDVVYRLPPAWPLGIRWCCSFTCCCSLQSCFLHRPALRCAVRLSKTHTHAHANIIGFRAGSLWAASILIWPPTESDLNLCSVIFDCTSVMLIFLDE